VAAKRSKRRGVRGKSSKSDEGKSGRKSAAEQYKSLDKANRTWHLRVAKTVERARKAAGA
jgi:hypothetical protein